MTKRSNFSVKPWLAVLSLGVTVGGWALLGRQLLVQQPDASAPLSPGQPAASQSVAVTLPPVPTVEALQGYAANGTGAGQVVIVPAAPVVTETATRPKIDKAPAISAPQRAPIARTGSSR